ncbi:MFS transporter [Streptomyces amakusaensis]|uniref:Transcriptional regulator n=1 Tax=Streptomyces amakusaensis TaxID=67271 RepID=A0ABW0AVK7_9ACTN
MVESEAADLLRRVLDLLGCRDHGAFLRRLAAHHEGLGLGPMATRPEKVSRWKRGVRPDRHTEAAMADLLHVPIDQTRALGWPTWLHLALADDQVLLTAPWTPAGALTALEHLGRPETDMNRRSALLSGGILSATTLAHWATASPAHAVLHDRRPHVSARSAHLIEDRLAALRAMDDEIGSGETHELARSERAMITTVLRTRSYTADVGRRLFSAAAEASRICGWTAFDSGDTDAAERHYLGAARAAASADDPAASANILAFWSMARYSLNDTPGALDYAHAALHNATRTGSPRLIAMAHARTSRAHAKAGDHLASRQAEEAAFTAHARTGDPGDEPACVYWVTHNELLSWAASNATDLGDHRRALTHYTEIAAGTPPPPHDGDAYPRSRALRLTREADAHLALRDIDTAVHTAQQAVQTMGGVTSARGTTIHTSLRNKLRTHQSVPAVRDFLEHTA